MLLFAAEGYRVLQENGKFLLIDNVAPEQNELDTFYNTVEKKKRDKSHYRAWKKSEWISLLERSGFTVQQLVTFSKKTFQFEKNGANKQDCRKRRNKSLSSIC
ncbi:hypothetical protein GCM10020331_072300 [Ectobacillus funiculus]